MKWLRLSLLVAGVISLRSCSVARYAENISYPQIGSDIAYEGILEECYYKCSVDGPEERRMYVYLPADYYSTTTRYPVYYLLHGARGNELSWIVKGNLLHNIDSLLSANMMKKTIVVLPNVCQYDDDQDFGKSRIKGAIESFFENDGKVEYSFITDVVAKIDSTYRTVPHKSHRAIGGLSIGALQSIHISASNPEMFDYVGLFSPMVHPFIKHSKYSSFYSSLKKRQELQFATPPTLYWVMIGKTDFFYPRMNSYCKYLSRKGYRYEYHVSSGGHQWFNWVEYNNMFMQKLWTPGNI
jgi:enterochelin esterase family protein